MEIAITVLLLATAVVLVALAVQRARAQRAEDTLRSISDLVSSPDEDRAVGSDLVSRIRSVVTRSDRAAARSRTYESALSGVSVGVAIVDSDGTIQFTNPAARALIEGTGDWAVLRTRVSLLAREVVKTGRSERIDVDMHEPHRKVIVLRASPLRADTDDSSAVRAVAIYLDDRTDQRQLNAIRRDFVANASHELKTPLGALSLLAETLGYADDEAKRALLAERLKAEAHRMANVVDDIITLARTESPISDRAVGSTRNIIADAVEAVSELATAADIQLVAGEIVDLEVNVDHNQVVSAVRNLLDNAVTYTAVKDEPGTVTYSCRVESGNACIAVADTGIGIPSRYTSRVFERFFRVDSARSRNSGGTGLGLSIVKNVAKAHGGSVSVESRLGVGTTMSFCLPIAGESSDRRDLA